MRDLHGTPPSGRQSVMAGRNQLGNSLPERAVTHTERRAIAQREWQEALETIRDLAESRAPGALGQILAISLDALRHKHV